MFTGIIEATGGVSEIALAGRNKTFWIESNISDQLKPDQSVSHDGVCLTIEEVKNQRHKVTAIAETLEKTNLDQWRPGHRINIERCLKIDGRLDGHFVQGHVDTTADCINKKDLQGSWEFRFRIPLEFGELIIEKGSIAINGVSLTTFNISSNELSVAIIPFTYEHTNLKEVTSGTIVNIEFDMIGKYFQRIMKLRATI